MFIKLNTNKTKVTEAIDSLLDEMAVCSGDSEEYAKMNDQLTKLYELKEIDQKVTTHKRVSAETLLVVGGNILGILLIIGYERENVLTSKALSLLTKVK